MPDDRISVLVPVSPIPSHPAAHILDCTVASIRHRLPEARIIVMFDGCPPHRGDRLPAYREHVEQWRKDADSGKWGNCETIDFGTWHHQSAMTTHVLANVIRTPLILFVEQDTPLVGPIDFAACTGAIQGGGLHLVRFHYGTDIGPHHAHMTLDAGEPQTFGELHAVRTSQWSQRPHLADAVWYGEVIADLIGARRTFIEDAVHAPVAKSWTRHGEAGWARYRLAVYAQEGKHDMLRSVHLDGRGGDEKQVEV